MDELAANEFIYVKRISCGKIVIVYTVRHTVNNVFKKVALKGKPDEMTL